MDIEQLKKYFRKNYFGIFVGEDKQSKFNIRLRPFVGAPIDTKLRETVRDALRDYGVSAVIIKNGIRIQGIENCSMCLKFLNEVPDWWVDCLEKMKNGEHNTSDGIINIVRIRNRNSKSNFDRKWKLGVLIDSMSK